MYDLSHPLVWDAIMLAFVIGWTLCFQLIVPGLLKSSFIKFKMWIRNGIGGIKSMVPNKTDIVLYAGMLIILASIWLGDYSIATKSMWSGVWLIIVALYMALPEWLGNDNATP